MAIKRFMATADTTITNAFLEDLTTRATGANMGLADSLEVFSVYGQVSGGLGTNSLYLGAATGSSGFSPELSRILVKFPVTTADDSTHSIQAKRNSGGIPASGSVSFFLRMYNVEHHESLPTGITLNVLAVASSSWEEGRGVDLDTYKDKTLDGVGANWINASDSTKWTKPGGDFHAGDDRRNRGIVYSQTLTNGNEDIELNITDLVESWIKYTATNVTNYGIGIFLTSSQEAYFSSSAGDSNITSDLPAISGGLLHNPAGAKTSYYTKKFSARSSEYFFKRPCIEARWNSATKDDRGNFYYSSSLATGLENLNTLYLYNYFRGTLRNIPSIGTGNIYVNIYSGSATVDKPEGGRLTPIVDGSHVTSTSPTVITGTYISTGIYSASFCLTSNVNTTSLTKIYDVWNDGELDSSAAQVQFYTGSFSPKKIFIGSTAPNTKFVSNITNLKKVYRADETARFRVYTRLKDWNPNVYTKAVSSPEVNVVESGSYEIYRVIDDLKVVAYGTGSALHTQMSFDASGSYFDLDMNLVETGYMYGIKMAFYNESVGDWVEQPQTYKFRVEN